MSKRSPSAASSAGMSRVIAWSGVWSSAASCASSISSSSSIRSSSLVSPSTPRSIASSRPIERSSEPSPKGESSSGGAGADSESSPGDRDRLHLLLGLRLGARGARDPPGDVLLDDSLDLLLGEAGGEGDLRRGGLAGRLVGGGHVDDAVGVDLEGDVDLDVGAQPLLEAGELELAEQRVVLRLPVIALVDADLHRLLVVLYRGERAGLLDRDRRVAFDDRLGESAGDADAQVERRHVEEHRVLCFADERGGVDRRPHGHDLVRVDVDAGAPAGSSRRPPRG